LPAGVPARRMRGRGTSARAGPGRRRFDERRLWASSDDAVAARGRADDGGRAPSRNRDDRGRGDGPHDVAVGAGHHAARDTGPSRAAHRRHAVRQRHAGTADGDQRFGRGVDPSRTRRGGGRPAQSGVADRSGRSSARQRAGSAHALGTAARRGGNERAAADDRSANLTARRWSDCRADAHSASSSAAPNRAPGAFADAPGRSNAHATPDLSVRRGFRVRLGRPGERQVPPARRRDADALRHDG
jgi:hypothetical protein